ncbi:MAG: DNA helicase II [Candidatus Marinimicrobia bacterium]|nr:DNA helicase II [Candidatus Neomarinimicrobiota bacterium]
MSDPFDLSEEHILERAENPPSTAPAWLEDLNPEQREAVKESEGPVLVLSGAGTGKTRVLITRLAYMLAEGKARPWQILSVTFTNRAAREMRERVTELVGPTAEDIWLGTFHAICVKILRRHGELVGLKSNFTILDSDDQLRLLKQIMEAANIDSKKWPAQGLMGIIQRWKDQGLTPERVSNIAGRNYAAGRSIQLYQAYQERLKTLNASDFGDLILHCLTIFKKSTDVLSVYQEKFHYVMVDEYQDTNVAQYLWLRLLTQTRHNLCCVGDDDQSIYSWRGAEVGNILRFEKDFPDAKVIRLERNYRSTPTILAAASHLITHNEDRLGKTLRTANNENVEPGAPIKLRGLWDGQEEARWLVDEIEILQRENHKLSDIAILVRTGFQMLEFEERLITAGIPYRVVGGPRFYERMEIRDAIAYLRIVFQPNDDLAFERIINKPKRGIGQNTVQKIHILARTTSTPLMEAAKRIIETDELRAQARSTLRALIKEFSKWRNLAESMVPAELSAMILEESGYVEMWKKDNSPEGPGRLDNLREFVTGLDEWDSIPGFLEHVSLVMDNDTQSSSDSANLMTLHAAKGLEFDTVFLPGWEEDIFPNRRSLDEGGQKSLEEERRLAYVGLTRARQRVLVSFAANRRVYNQWKSSIPSRFISELPKSFVQEESEAGLYGQSSEDSWPGFPGGGASKSGARIARDPQLADGEYYSLTQHELEVVFKVGERIFHQKFGYGVIKEIDGSKLEIDFEKAGRKKVLDSFIQTI